MPQAKCAQEWDNPLPFAMGTCSMPVQTLGEKSRRDFPCKHRHMALLRARTSGKAFRYMRKRGGKKEKKWQKTQSELVSAGVIWRNRIHHPRPHISFGKNPPCSLSTTAKSPKPAAKHLPTPRGGHAGLPAPTACPGEDFLAGSQQFLSPHSAKSSALQKKNPNISSLPSLLPHPSPALTAHAAEIQLKALGVRGLQPPPCAQGCPLTWEYFPKFGSADICAFAIAREVGALLSLYNPELHSQPFLFPRHMTKRRNISF